MDLFFNIIGAVGGIVTTLIAATFTYLGVRKNARVTKAEAEEKLSLEGEKLASSKWMELSGHFEERLSKAERKISEQRTDLRDVKKRMGRLENLNRALRRIVRRLVAYLEWIADGGEGTSPEQLERLLEDSRQYARDDPESDDDPDDWID